MAEKLIKLVEDHFPDSVLASHSERGQDTVVIPPKDVPEVIAFLKHDEAARLNFLRFITGVDYDKRIPRFEVVYVLYSTVHKHMLTVRTPVEEDACQVPTIGHVYEGAGWQEREVWDMYGIRFDGHPDLRRVLNYEEFDGHPLRKDYPKQQGQPRVELLDRERDSVEEFETFVKDHKMAGSREA